MAIAPEAISPEFSQSEEEAEIPTGEVIQIPQIIKVGWGTGSEAIRAFNKETPIREWNAADLPMGTTAAQEDVIADQAHHWPPDAIRPTAA
jgi:hypothetical protein